MLIIMAFFLDTQVRTVFGKGVRTLRKQGVLPAVIYGGGKKNIALSMRGRAFEKIRKNAGESSLIELHEQGGTIENVLIHEVDYDPITHKPRHVDFLRVRMDEVLRVAIPFRFEGESPTVKEGGILVKVMHEAEVEALPGNLPRDIVVDLARLVSVGDRFTLADLVLPNGVSFAGDKESVIVLIEEPRVEEEAAAAESSESAQIEKIEVADGKKEKDKESGQKEESSGADEKGSSS